jgi:putative Holliday junction resolvase
MKKQPLFATLEVMKLLGIDYGTKQIGLAVADTDTSIATPLNTINNDGNALRRVNDICANKGIDTIVIGESTDRTGEDNPVMEHANEFANELINATETNLVFFDEFGSSVAASCQPNNPTHLDGSAAAIILQRYLEQSDE